jgi:type IV pilus assembly protein PilY1
VADAAGAVHHGYVGDLQGNLWRLDFSGGAPWSKLVSSGGPLFVAKDEGGKRQPISVQPKVIFGPGGGYVVLFGTGKFVEAGDAASGNFAMQSFYAVFDAAGSTAATLVRSSLSKRTLTPSNEGYAVAGDLFSYGAGSSQKKGWYFDFPDSDKSGERLITSPALMSGMLFFNTLIPSADPCGSGGGRSYVLNALSGMPTSGESTGILSQIGMLSAPIVFQTENAVGDRDAIGRRSVSKKYAIVNFGTGGTKGMAAPASGKPVQVTVPAGRFSWREIPNWKELKAAALEK